MEFSSGIELRDFFACQLYNLKALCRMYMFFQLRDAADRAASFYKFAVFVKGAFVIAAAVFFEGFCMGVKFQFSAGEVLFGLIAVLVMGMAVDVFGF